MLWKINIQLFLINFFHSQCPTFFKIEHFVNTAFKGIYYYKNNKKLLNIYKQEKNNLNKPSNNNIKGN